MNQQEYNRLRELGWRRWLTPTEEVELQQYLISNPADREDWQSEADLNLLLEKLPETPRVSSNFTARVLKAVELETAAQARQRAASPFWQGYRSWLPRLAVTAIVLSFLSAGYHQTVVNARATLARNVASVTETVSSDPELMKDFEPIRQLSERQPVGADTELIALMK